MPKIEERGSDSLHAFIRQAMGYPLLSHEEEYVLAICYQETGQADAVHKLVNSHLRLVIKIAMEHKGYGFPITDLIAEGTLGLLRAIDKFEPEREHRLSTYAMWWIKASIGNYILKNWSLVPLGSVTAQKKLFFSLKRIKHQLGISDDKPLNSDNIKAIATVAELSERDVVQINDRLSARDLSLNSPLSDENALEHLDLIADCRVSQEESLEVRQQEELQTDTLSEALNTLNERDREIVKARYMRENPLSLKELGQKYGISGERVRQLEARGLEILRNFLKAHSRYSQLRLYSI